MHEASIAEDILNIAAKRLGEPASLTCALKICIKVGELRNVDGDSLTFAFDNLKGRYPGFSSCKLETLSIKAEALCHQGKHKYNPRLENAFCCEHCGSGIGEIISGEELDLVKITVGAAENEVS